MTDEVLPGSGSESNHSIVATRRFNEVAIGQRGDGYLNATAMCRAAGKEWAHYDANKQTHDFLAELSAKLGIPSLALVQVKRGGNAPGTWVHPQVAYHLAQWCSAAFAVQVTEWIHDIKTQGYATAPGVSIASTKVRRESRRMPSGAALRELMRFPGFLRQQFPGLSDDAVQAAFSRLSGAVIGEPLVPLPQLKSHLYTADAIAEEHGITRSRVGRIANAAGIPRDETTGKSILGLSEHGPRQVEHWHWNAHGKALVDAAIRAWKEAQGAPVMSVISRGNGQVGTSA